MTFLAIFLLGGSASLALLVAVGSWLGRCIHFANPSTEHPIPSDQDARLIEMHRAIHDERWGV